MSFEYEKRLSASAVPKPQMAVEYRTRVMAAMALEYRTRVMAAGTAAGMALEYRTRVMAAVPADHTFEPLMTLRS
ncbi:hypothetical protein T484DRAFT_1784939 [Baffinella frigidus]|nr:hypothetical protein T484DRAFT_1784939 [Cryptophyta sp. CCMP2293]